MEHMAEIIIAILSLVGALAGSYMANNKTQALIGYRIDELEKKVEKHNNVIERTIVLERDVKTAFNRIDEIRNDVKELKKEK